MEYQNSSELSTSMFMISSEAIIEEPGKYPDIVRYSALFIGVPFTIIGFLGNLFSIIAVLKTKSLRTGTNIFIIGLATFDLLYSCIVIPTAVTVHWNNAWVLGDVYCQVFPILLILIVGEILMSIAGTAVSRYLKIIHPTVFRMIFGQKLNICFLLFSIWSIPILTLFPAMIGVWGKLGYEPKTLFCSVLRDNSHFNSFVALTGFIIPILFISFCYLRILCKVCSNHRKIAAARRQISMGQAGTSGASHKEQREDLRYTKMMVAIFIVFLIAYAPYMINNLLDPHHDHKVRGFYTASCVWLFPCLNPILYVLLNRQFRRAFLTILPYNCGKCNPDNMEASVTTQPNT